MAFPAIDWRTALKLHSVRLALVVGPLIGWCAAHPAEIKMAIDQVGLSPTAAGVLVWLLATAIPTIARLTAQPAVTSNDGASS